MEVQAGNLTPATVDPSALGHPEARPNSTPTAPQVDDVVAARTAPKAQGATLSSR